MIKPTIWAVSLTLTLALLSCAEQYESFYLNTREGKLEVKLQALYPSEIDSTLFRFTGTAPMRNDAIENDAIVLELAKVPMGQHLTEIEVYSQVSDASTDQKLTVKRQDVLNTYIPLLEPSQGVSIPGPGDKTMDWTTHVVAFHAGQAERLEVQPWPQSTFVGVQVDPNKTIRQVTLNRIATIAGRKAEPIFKSFEKQYAAEEFYQKSSEGGKMYDYDGFTKFHNSLKGLDVRKMTYKYKVEYTDGTVKAFEFAVRL